MPPTTPPTYSTADVEMQPLNNPTAFRSPKASSCKPWPDMTACGNICAVVSIFVAWIFVFLLLIVLFSLAAQEAWSELRSAFKGPPERPWIDSPLTFLWGFFVCIVSLAIGAGVACVLVAGLWGLGQCIYPIFQATKTRLVVRRSAAAAAAAEEEPAN